MTKRSSSSNSVSSFPARVDGEMRRQVQVLADQPAEGLMWSDVFDHLRGAVLATRRLIAQRPAHAAR